MSDVNSHLIPIILDVTVVIVNMTNVEHVYGALRRLRRTVAGFYNRLKTSRRPKRFRDGVWTLKLSSRAVKFRALPVGIYKKTKRAS